MKDINGQALSSNENSGELDSKDLGLDHPQIFGTLVKPTSSAEVARFTENLNFAPDTNLVGAGSPPDRNTNTTSNHK